jgi:hypothetical protein
MPGRAANNATSRALTRSAVHCAPYNILSGHPQFRFLGAPSQMACGELARSERELVHTTGAAQAL